MDDGTSHLCLKRRIGNINSILFWLLLCVPIVGTAEMGNETTTRILNQFGRNIATLPELIYQSSEHFSNIDSANLDGLLERIGDSRLVLLGESSHGTEEFYEMRARITRELVEKKGFTVIAAEADWPDASLIDHFISRSNKQPVISYQPFGGFPSWMWKNQSIETFLGWLKEYNQQFYSPVHAIRFYGLDIYNLFGSIEAVLNYLQDVDPAMAEVAYGHYGCLMPWANDPSSYSQFMEFRRHRGCKAQARIVLNALRKGQAYYQQIDKDRYFDAEQNAHLVINSEHYFRTKYQGVENSWNLRDESMFQTLLRILDYHGQASKIVVWAHNSHVGDARATQMRANGELNLGQRVRETFGNSAYLIGFGTNKGTVAAASTWGGPMEIMDVPPARNDSYENVFHSVKTKNFMLPLRQPILRVLREKLWPIRLQRGIGTTYDPDPETEYRKHYFFTSLLHQFDEYIWFDETQAIQPLDLDLAQ